uniref:Protein-lysine N-methyltransferase n=1 Tax=Angiostrongylus costaricensis TaxID=334426 RepID=A0A0R3Q136_ANGCS
LRFNPVFSWDSRYEQELRNFEEFGDEGDIWFGRSAEKRLKSACILDLGCGNGSLLRKLRSSGYSQLTGIDYSASAIELAQRLSNEDQKSGNVLDILSPSDILFSNQYDVLLDKGTWDAMSLSNDRDSRVHIYRTAVKDALTSRGKFVILSCNFTREELCQFFDDGSSLVFITEIPAAHSFTFGGRAGVTSTGVVFERK